MKIGTRSILFGVHQFVLHPLFVLRAWMIIYRKFPCLYELYAIITHDWGYWGSPNMDGAEGKEHPERIAQWWRCNSGAKGFTFCWNIADEISGHSRFHVAKYGGELSPLFRADKLAVVLYPRWLYLLLANLSGEIHEYMEVARRDTEYTVDTETQTRWLLGISAHMIMMGFKGSEYELIPRKMNKVTTADVECEACGWKGSWQALIIFQQANRELCPACGAPDSIIELDGVGEGDYREQERRGRG